MKMALPHITKHTDRICGPAAGARCAMTDSRLPSWRKMARSTILWLGFVAGAATALLYEALVGTSPPPDWSHMRLRAFVGVYVAIPILIFGGTGWLCNWIAECIDPDRPQD